MQKNFLKIAFLSFILFIFCAETGIVSLCSQSVVYGSVPTSVENTLPCKALVLQATAYTKSIEEGTSNGLTLLETPVRRGVAAVDPELIPLGTELYIEGYGFARAEDIGGAIKGKHIDLFMESKKEAFAWGRKEVKTWILPSGEKIEQLEMNVTVNK